MRKIAVVSFTRMGDLVQSTPLLRSLKNENSYLTLIAYNEFAEAARHLPMIDRVVEFDVNSFVPLLDARHEDLLKAYHFVSNFARAHDLAEQDIVINLSHTRMSARLCQLLEGRETWGMTYSPANQLISNGEWFNYLLSVMQDRVLNPYNLVEIYQRFSPYEERVARLEFSVYKEDKDRACDLLLDHGLNPNEPYVVLQLGASSPSRQWPMESYRDLARRLIRAGRQVALTGSAAESEMTEIAAQECGSKAISIAGKTSIGLLAAILEGAESLVSNDTGTIHLAAAVGTRTIGIFVGPASAKDTAPYGNNHIILEPDLPCAPCGYYDTCVCPSCGDLIRPDHVFDLVIAQDSEIKFVAKGIYGVRAFRTQVESNGEFRILALSNPETGVGEDILRLSREFWEFLLCDKSTNLNWSVHLAPNYREAFRGEIRDLRNLLKLTQTALDEMSVQMSGNKREFADISILLGFQTYWENRLRDFMKHSSLIPPFLRFILVRLSMLDKSNLATYMEGVFSTVELFARGVHLMQRLVGKSTVQRATYAEAE